jgi:hypothetical protein
MSLELLSAPQTINWPSPSPTGPSQLDRAIRDEVERELESTGGQEMTIHDDGRDAATAKRWTDALASLALLRSGESPLISYSTAFATLEEVPRFADYQRGNFGERSFCIGATNPHLLPSWLDHLDFAPDVAPESLNRTVGIPLVVNSTGFVSKNVDHRAVLRTVAITALGRSAFDRVWRADLVERDERPQVNPAMPRLAAALREGRINGQGLPRPGARRLRYVEDDPDTATEEEQIGFGRAGDPPAEMHRRSRRQAPRS